MKVSRWIAADTEDNARTAEDPFKKRCVQIAAMSEGGDRFHNRGDADEFFNWLAPRPEKIVYFHNAQYDLGNLFRDELDQLSFTLVGGRLIKAVWDGRKKTFADSFNIYPMALAKIGEKFGIEKGELDEENPEYVWTDVEILHEAMRFAWKVATNNGLEKLPFTLGGLCVAIWQEMGGENWFCNTLEAREAFFGGRVELFQHLVLTPQFLETKRGQEWQTEVGDLSRLNHTMTDQISYTDLNSLYPSVMQLPFPDRLEACEEWPKWGIADVTIDVPKDELIPPLPFRAEKKRLIDDEEERSTEHHAPIFYPVGRMRGIWTVHEIDNAVKHGARIKEIHGMAGSNTATACYSAFVSRFYDERLESTDEAWKLVCKLLMNNLYGRLALKGKITMTFPLTFNNFERAISVFGSKCLIDVDVELPEWVNWFHAAYVTSYGRLKLQEYMRMIGADRMIYCDTDSCIFTGRPPFECSTDLGKMKLEGVQQFAQTFGPKVYQVDDFVKAKGVPRNKAEEFVRLSGTSFQLPFKLREAIRFYDDGNRKPLSTWRTVERRIRTEYKRKKLRGNRFFPIDAKDVFK